MDREKIYKGEKCGNVVILLGDLSRLPDESFSKKDNFRGTIVFIDEAFLSRLSKYFGDGEYINFLEKGNVTNVALMVTQICQDCNWWKGNNYLNVSGKKDSNGMVKLSNCLIRNYGDFNYSNYINISVCDNFNHVGMAEWLTRLSDTQCPSGFVGSIPPSGVIFNFGDELREFIQKYDFVSQGALVVEETVGGVEE